MLCYREDRKNGQALIGLSVGLLVKEWNQVTLGSQT